MASRRRSSDRKEAGDGDGRASRRKFLRRVAYTAPLILTFVASRANAQAGTCNPAQCRPVDCAPGDCTPGPCPPQSCRPNN